MSSKVSVPIKEQTSVDRADYRCNSNGSMVQTEFRRSRITKSKELRKSRSKKISEAITHIHIDAITLFCKYTSAHGFKCAVSPERKAYARYMWKVAIIMSLASLTWALLKLRSNYYEYPLNTVLDVNYVQMLPFPGVTLCNLQPFDYRKADLLPNVRNGSTKLYNINLAEGVTYYKDVGDYLADPTYNDILDQPLFRLHELLGRKINETFKYCAWNGAKRACEEIFKIFPTLDGHCYQFNYNTSEPVNTSAVGPSTGLSLWIIQADEEENSMLSSGLKVLLHNPGTFPDIVTRGFLVPTGFATFGRIQIQKTFHIGYPYKTYGGRHCEPRKIGTELSAHSRDSCMASCALNLSIAVCHCSIYAQDNDAAAHTNTTMCSYRQVLACIRPTFFQAHKEATSNQTIDQSDWCSSKCQYECEVTTFSMTTSHATYSSPPVGRYGLVGTLCVRANTGGGYVQDIVDFPVSAGYTDVEIQPVTTPQHLVVYLSTKYGRGPVDTIDGRVNYLELRLFFDHMIQEEIRYLPEYSWHSILGIVGGYMGLFIGASVLTICEALECIFFLMHEVYTKVRDRIRTLEESNEADQELSSD